MAPDETPPVWGLGSLTVMSKSHAVRAFTCALEAPITPGVRVLNAAATRSWVADPVADILRNGWGNDVDLSHFEQSGHAYDLRL
ncbi:MAG: hypothetical protein O3B73_09765 [bacterium]|nr:hypothetical protein [bacterium]